MVNKKTFKELIVDLGYEIKPEDETLLKTINPELEKKLIDILHYWNEYLIKVDCENEALRSENITLSMRNNRLEFDIKLCKNMLAGRSAWDDGEEDAKPEDAKLQ